MSDYDPMSDCEWCDRCQEYTPATRCDTCWRWVCADCLACPSCEGESW